MKIQHSHFARKNENGLVTAVFITLLAIMMILVMAETRSLIHLRRETKLLEQQQVKRLNPNIASENSTANPATK